MKADYMLWSLESSGYPRFRKTDEAQGSYQSDDEEIGFFLTAFMRGPVRLNGPQIIAFAISGRNPAENVDFTQKLKIGISDPKLPLFIRNMVILDTSEILKQKHFYVLDDHLNRSGHQVMADAIAGAIERIEERKGSM